MKSIKVTIFGASGGIGKHAVQSALDRGYHVTAYVRNPDKLKLHHENLTVIKGALTDYEAMRQALHGADAAVWCVGITMKRHKDRPALEGHKTLLEAIKAEGVTRLIDWERQAFPLRRTNAA